MADMIVDDDGDDGTMDAVVPDELSLLNKVEAMLQVEHKLTSALDRAGPWLESASAHTHRRRVRPVPRTAEQARQVLQYARVLSNRTSAPAGWNPNAPVVGFSTPNPLPHQLRGGALAALQLERARQRQLKLKQQLEQSNKVRRHEKEESEKEKEKRRKVVDAKKQGAQGEAGAADDAPSRDPKRRDVVAHQQQDSSAANAQRGGAITAGAAAAASPAGRTVASQLDVSMNLSSGSSSSEEEDEDDDDDEEDGDD
jgi:Vitamin-D-receptor interacting Mediator subunit 4